MARRAFTLLVVLVAVTLGALVATTALTMGGARTSAARSSVQNDQLRALGSSGLLAVMRELELQRDDLMRGGTPTMDGEIVVYETEFERGVVTVVDLDGAGEGLLASEAARVNLNHAPAEVVAALPGMRREWADAIVAARDARPLDSPEDTLALGVEPSAWFGGGAGAQAGASAEAGDALAVPGLGFGRGIDEPLRELVTVFSADPSVRSGFGEDGDGARGRRRVPLHLGWSDGIEAEITESLGEGWASVLRRGVEESGPIDTGAALGSIATMGVDVEGWREFYDTLCVTDAPFVPGLVDVNRASEAVLGAWPALGAEGAELATRERDGLDDEQRASARWLVERGVIEDSDGSALLGWAAARSMQWRVRLEARIEAVGVEDRALETIEWLAAAEGPDGLDPVGRTLVLEAVVDVATPRARVVYLRDLTHLDLARALHEAAGQSERGDAFEGLGMDADGERVSLGAERSAGLSGTEDAPSGSVRTPQDREPEAPSREAATDAGEPGGTGRAGAVGDIRVGRWRGPGGGG